MFVSVCVGSIRGYTLAHLIASIQAQEHDQWELIIAAQGRDPALLSLVQQAARQDPRLSYLILDRYGKSHALNEAIKVAHGDILAFTDDDCIASPAWLSTVVDCFTREPAVGIVAGNVIAAPRQRGGITSCPATYTIEYIYRPAEENYSAPRGFYWGGGNFAVRRSVLETVGPFDEYFGSGSEFPAAEDVDYALRAEALGVVIWTTPRSVIHHTFGRRYGLRNVLRHHRAYALGSGALGGKLVLWRHRLARPWNEHMQFRNLAANLVRDFPRNVRQGALDLFRSRYYAQGLREYLSRFELDSQLLSHPKYHSAPLASSYTSSALIL